MTVPLRIGLLRLADSLPVMMARELKLFEKAGIAAKIMVEPSWSNIADGLSWGHLDAAVMFPPLAIMTYLGKRGRPTPLLVAANLSYGGNTIVLRDGALERETAPRLAVVHAYSTHFLLLRQYLLEHCPQAIDCVAIMPPDTMLDALSTGKIDGFCAGPPWGAAAERAGIGRIVGGSSSLRPGHLEKQFVVTEKWAGRYPDEAAQLKTILAGSITQCLDPDKRVAVIDILTRPVRDEGFAFPTEVVETTMPESGYPHAFELHPSKETSIGWIATEMRSLGWINKDDDIHPWM